MRVHSAAVLAMLAASLPSLAQRNLPSATQRYHDGYARVWMIADGPGLWVAPPSGKLPTQLGASTAGDFGQTSSSVGQTASSSGQTAGGFGQLSSSTGTPSSSTGATAGSFGQTAGGFGQVSSDYHGPGPVPIKTFKPGELPVGPAAAPEDQATIQLWTQWFGTLFAGHDYRNFLWVRMADLEQALAQSANTSEAPDLLLSFQPSLPDGVAARYKLLAGPGWPKLARMEVTDYRAHPPPRTWLAANSPRIAAAKQTILTLDGSRDCPGCQDSGSPPVLTAIGAMQHVLMGAGVGAAADAAMAEFPAPAGQSVALGGLGGEASAGLEPRVQVEFSHLGPNLAVVGVQAIVEGPAIFGLVHAVVTLRPDATGQWRVLQISPGLDRGEDDAAREQLESGFRKTHEPLQGISQAAPENGDNRQPQPELWWDNLGGATEQVIEWQRRTGASWQPSNLFFIPDSGPRARTRVTAKFADRGQFRWRVWSMGSGGVILSPWRTLNIIP